MRLGLRRRTVIKTKGEQHPLQQMGDIVLGISDQADSGVIVELVAQVALQRRLATAHPAGDHRDAGLVGQSVLQHRVAHAVLLLAHV